MRLLDTSLIRIGNSEYARDNRSFGLTTLRDRHVEIDGASLRFEFRGKSGKLVRLRLRDRRLARLVRACRDIPGQELFQYLDDDGNRHPVGSADVNDYLREVSGQDFTAKDFRTWAGTALAVVALRELGPAADNTAAKHKLVLAVAAVAERLGNTPAVCRKSYIHPLLQETCLDGSLLRRLEATANRLPGLRDEEAALLGLLEVAMPEARDQRPVMVNKSLASQPAPLSNDMSDHSTSSCSR